MEAQTKQFQCSIASVLHRRVASGTVGLTRAGGRKNNNQRLWHISDKALMNVNIGVMEMRRREGGGAGGGVRFLISFCLLSGDAVWWDGTPCWKGGGVKRDVFAALKVKDTSGCYAAKQKCDETWDIFFPLFLIRKEPFGLHESAGSWLNLSWFKNTITWGGEIKTPSISSQPPHINITWSILFLINICIFWWICLSPPPLF